MTPSPWWYRRRALTIGAIYLAGFFFGPLISGFVNLPVDPTFIVLGRHFGAFGDRPFLIAAVVLAAACWGLRAWGGAYLRPSTVWNPDALNDRLIIAGPFRFVRNPLYLGNVLLALAMGVYATPLGAVLIVIGNVAIGFALMSVEETLLRTRYGAAFEAYAAAVPAMLPRPLPWRGAPAGGAAPSLALGLRSELFSGAFVLGTAIVAIYFWNR